MLLRLAIAFSIVAAGPSIAWPCGNSMFVDGDDAVQQVSQAERLLARGKLDQAASKVNPRRYHFAEAGVRKRAMIVTATVAFRQPKNNSGSWQVNQGIDRLEGALKKDKDSPLLQARLAEGYAMSSASVGKATSMLEDLAKRDIMPDAIAYRTLARLRAQAGDADGGDAAIAQCKAMAKQKSVCTIAPTVREPAADAEPSKARPVPRNRRVKSKLRS